MSSSSSFPRTPPHSSPSPSPQPPPSASSSSNVTVSITSPLLSPQSRSPSRTGLLNSARFFRRAVSLREPSMLVREAAAEQLEERQTDWAYSRPVVVLDVIWNFAFVTAASTVIIVSRDERPSVPLRVWIAGYALQCVLHAVCVGDEFRRRERRRTRRGRPGGVDSVSEGMVDAAEDSRDGSGSIRQYVSLSELSNDEGSSVAKHLESANTVFSFIWWIVGFYWISAGPQSLANDSPLLYWLCIIFLGFEVFFVVFCIALACAIGIAVFCCLPSIIAILYTVAGQEGASREAIEKLPKFNFLTIANGEKLITDIRGPLVGVMTEGNAKESPNQHYLSKEDAECCICLSAYEDGAELRELPCEHHFHCTCVDKWLHINATCPLCKFNILKMADQGQEEV